MNYQLELDKIIEKIDVEHKPRLLLHSCCGPCSSYVLKYLSEYFNITVLYFNPCIYPIEEYDHRKRVQMDLIRAMNAEGRSINFLESEYEHYTFLELVKGYEDEPECGERCHICYRQRLQRAAEEAIDGKYDFFTTTLTVSPYKNAQVLNDIGEEIARSLGVSWLPCDFKKREGYKQSVELSKVYNLYRQDFCGCEFSVSE